MWYSLGIDGVRIPTSLEGRKLSKENFPKLLLKTVWPDTHAKYLISAYLRWQAPYLLTLQNLGDNLRDKYEHHLNNYAFVVHDLYKLYSKIINQQLINRALVEAELRITAKGSAGD